MPQNSRPLAGFVLATVNKFCGTWQRKKQRTSIFVELLTFHGVLVFSTSLISNSGSKSLVPLLFSLKAYYSKSKSKSCKPTTFTVAKKYLINFLQHEITSQSNTQIYIDASIMSLDRSDENSIKNQFTNQKAVINLN